MRFCGIDPRTIHPAISIAKEIYPGMARREVMSTRGNSGETLAGYQEERDEAVIRVNIGARSRDEAYEARAALAKWAAASGEKTGVLEPTHWRGKAYNAILSEISPPEFKIGFATVEVIFVLPRAQAYDIAQSYAAGSGKVDVTVGGSAKARPVITQTLDADASSLVWSVDGVPFMKLTGSIRAGSKVEADFAQDSLTIDGAHKESMIDYTATTWHPDFSPGRHAITSTDGGRIETRWHGEWI